MARMTGRAGPTDETLVENLERRVLAIEGPEGLERRFNRAGVPTRRNGNMLEKRFNRIGVPHKAQSSGSSSLATLKNGRNGRNGAAGASVAGSAGSTGPAASAGSQSQQTPPSDVTEANAPADSDSLGLDIE